MNIAIFDHEASRGPHMSSRRQHACESKMSNLSFQKIIFPRMKPIPSSTYMHLKLHTATESENHYFDVDAIIIENH